MICKHCRREIIDNAIYCPWCGGKQIKTRGSFDEVSVPEPKLLPSGKWRIQLRREGISITRDSSDECRKAAAIARVKWLTDELAGLHVPPPAKHLLGDAIDRYIAEGSNTRSPSTNKAYKSIRQYRFQNCMGWDLNDQTLNWQMAINAEFSDDISPKTISNAWNLCAAAIKRAGFTVPNVSLPRLNKSERPWLDYQQIQVFLDAIYGKPGELGALLALHSLRLSELLALKPTNVSLEKEKLFVRGARVLNSDGELVFKDENKTYQSSREIPIVIPRLKELLTETLKDCGEYVYPDSRNTLYFQVNRICERNNLPKVGVHGLRHSFASLAYHLGWKELSTMQVGGWSNSRIVKEIYTHNADLEEDIKTMQSFYKTRE